MCTYLFGVSQRLWFWPGATIVHHVRVSTSVVDMGTLSVKVRCKHSLTSRTLATTCGTPCNIVADNGVPLLLVP